jgi:hypothetical protein
MIAPPTATRVISGPDGRLSVIAGLSAIFALHFRGPVV